MKAGCSDRPMQQVRIPSCQLFPTECRLRALDFQQCCPEIGLHEVSSRSVLGNAVGSRNASGRISREQTSERIVAVWGKGPEVVARLPIQIMNDKGTLSCGSGPHGVRLLHSPLASSSTATGKVERSSITTRSGYSHEAPRISVNPSRTNQRECIG